MENIQVKLSSGRVAELRAISAREQINADACSKGDPVKIGYYRIAMAIAKIDDQDYRPATSDKQLDVVINGLTGLEIDELGAAYGEVFAPKGEVLKNESSPPSFG